MAGDKRYYAIGVPIIGLAYLFLSSYCLPVKLAIFFTALIVSAFIPADGDLTLLFFESCGKSAETLRGKVVWITGASTGLGAALANSLSSYGVKLVLSARSVKLLEEVKQKCIENGAAEENVFILPLDVLKYEHHQTACDQVIEHFNKIDILVSNAGRSQRAEWDTVDTEVDKELFELNVFSLISLARVVTRYFIKTGRGHHVITSSTAGKIGPPFSCSYNASKHALHGYFETLRFERSCDGIDITMLCPGPFTSNLMAGCFTDKLGKKVEKERKETIMTAERCADLCTVAIANKLSEVWIAENPVLMFYYVNQYFPSLFKFAPIILGKKYIMKLRDGHNEAVKT